MARRAWFILILGAGTGAWWLTSPGNGQVQIDTCTPQGALASLSEKLYGQRFWEAQLGELKRRAEFAEGWDALQAQNKAKEQELLNSVDASMESIYRQHPDLRPSAASKRAQALRDMADDVEEAEANAQISASFRKTAADARRCEKTIRAGQVMDRR